MHLSLYLSCKYRAFLLGMVADSNDKIPFVAGEVIYMVWLQIMNRGSYFVHYFNG